MALQVVNGAILQCSFGAAPAPMTELPVHRVWAGTQPAANITDHVSMVNIPSFGMCSCPGNPAVASATTAAAGVLTPMPCVPATVSPWVPGSPTVPMDFQPALNDTSTCVCTYGGVVSVTMAGQQTDFIP